MKSTMVPMEAAMATLWWQKMSIANSVNVQVEFGMSATPSNANAVYELPFGPGKRFLNHPGFCRAVAGSWQLSSVAMARTGFPVNVTVDRSASVVPDGNTTDQRPNLVPAVPLTPPGGSSTYEWVRGPGTWQIDMGLGKQFSLTERTQLQFRAEFFNILNHPQYGQPQSDFAAGPGAFGSILSPLNMSPVGTGTPRQVQFALRLVF